MATKIKVNQLDIEEILNDPSAAASETSAGAVEIATQAEVNTGTDTARVVTPSTLSNAYEPLDSTILRDADIGVTVQGFNANILVTGDIGITVAAQNHDHTGVYEPVDVTILRDADIGVTVAAFSHTHALNDLSDAIISGSPITNQVLIYNGVNWVNGTSPEGITDHTLLSNIGTNTHAQIDTHIADATIHFTTLDGLSDVAVGSPAGSPLLTGQVLTYNGSSWTNETPASGITDHTLLSNIGTNTHAQIDTHIADATIHFSALDGLSDVAVGSPAGSPLLTGQVLTYNGSSWVNETPVAGITDHLLLTNIGTNSHAEIDTHIADTTIHFTTLDGLSDVVLGGSPVTNEVLTFNGANWVAAPAAAGANNWLIANAGVDFATAPVAAGSNAIALGHSSSSAGTKGISIGSRTISGTGSSNTVMGYFAKSSSTANNVAIGPYTKAYGGNSVAIGFSSQVLAGDTSGIAIGDSAWCFDASGVAIGDTARVAGGGASATCIGTSTYANRASQVHVGTSVTGTSGGTTSTDYAIKIGYDGGTTASKHLMMLYDAGHFEVTGNKAQFVVPKYATASEPATPVQGSLIYDSTTDALKTHDGIGWNEVGGGASTLTELTDVTIGGSPAGSPLTNQVLTYDGSNWINATPAAGVTDHTLLTNIGTNTHAQIDTHIADVDINNNWIHANNGDLFAIAPLANTGGGTNAFAIGNNSSVTVGGSGCIGTNASCTTSYALALGHTSEASGGAGAMSFGRRATASAGDAIALGTDSDATNASAISIGQDSNALGSASIAIGRLADATSTYSIAIGKDANSTNTSAIAIGAASNASLINQVVLGVGFAVNEGVTDLAHSVKIGSGNATELHFLYLYTRGHLKLHGAQAQFEIPIYATASEPANPVEGSLIYDSTLDLLKTHDGVGWNEVGGALTLTELTDVTIGGSPAGSPLVNQVLTYDGANWVNAGTTGEANNNWLIANNNADFATAPVSSGTNSIALGNLATSTGVYSTAIGNNADAVTSNGISLGRNTTASGNSNTVLGYASSSNGQSTVVIGHGCSSSGNYNIVLGGRSTILASLTNQIGIGNSVTAASVTSDVAYSVKLGHGTGTNKNMIHLFDAGKMELYGTKAQFIVPKYATASEPASPLEGSLIYDSTLDVLKTHDGVGWNEVGGGLFTEDASNNIVGGSGAAPVIEATAYGNFITGAGAAANLTTGDDNVVIGRDALSEGTLAGQNIAIGFEALKGNVSFPMTATAGQNIAIGWQAANALRTSASQNVCIGGQAGFLLAGVNGNTLIGNASGVNINNGGDNTVIGNTAGLSISTGSRNVCLGRDSGPTVNVSDKLFIDTSRTDTPLIGGDFAANTVTITGSLTVSGTDTTLTFPNYVVGSPATYPANPFEGGVIYDSVAKGLQVYGGSPAGWSAVGGGLQNVVEDTTPQLGGDLDVNGYNIITPALVGAGTAGPINIISGNAPDSGGYGSNIALTSGNGAWAGGTIDITTGDCTSGKAGHLTLQAGQSNVSGSYGGGNVSIFGGANAHASGTGGYVQIAGAAQTTGTGNGGDVWIDGGTSAGGYGGNVIIHAGASTTGTPGKLSLLAGNANTSNTNNGGDVFIGAGSAQIGYTGGNVVLEPGGRFGDSGVVAIHTATLSTGQATVQLWDDTNTAHTTGNYVALKAPAFVGSPLTNITFVLPELDGSTGDVLQTDGSGNLSFAAGGLQNVVEDTTPQLGGDLDVLGNAITSTTGSGTVYINDNTYSSTYEMSLQSTTTDTWLEILNSTGGSNQGVFFGISTNDFEMWNYQGGAIEFYTHPAVSNGTRRLQIETDGTLNVAGTTNYEDLVTADDDIPNKKYVDDIVTETSMLMSVVFGI